MWQNGTVHPTHDMANEISRTTEFNNGDTLYSEQMDIELAGSNARHGAAIGYASEEQNGLALAPGRSNIDVRSGNQDPEQVGYNNSLAWGHFDSSLASDETTAESEAPAPAKPKVNVFLVGGLVLGALWLWNRSE